MLWKNKILQWLDSACSNGELAERYDQVAKDYEATFEHEFQYQGPKLATEFFCRYIPKEAKILDAGAGTGLTGKALTAMGYHNIVAIDLSQRMLEEAKKKNVYIELHQMVLGEALGFDTDYFDAVISTGVFAAGHAPHSSFDELVRITKNGGYIIFTLRHDIYENHGFKEKQETLELNGKWKLVEVSENLQLLPKVEPDVYHQIWVYQVSS